MVESPTATSERYAVLTAAVGRIADLWQWSDSRLGEILGLSPATVSRLRHGQTRLDPRSDAFEAGQLLLCLFDRLDALFGSDDDAARRWLEADNLDIGGKPIDRLVTMRGLIELCDYVDDWRARA
ncbi:MbcA/ParS/Xre antitoxin family protein [Croceicoccus bisphenolivorans]|uniref:MbcA/ParS/Xre antitoxin family protein n=1 Tax=Croceicoccus bisphenolivorans TaxID=1783232 RepID=UPI000832C124|nr:MbcA/ParS/Xre antitoxin family protein [Croceicoccus bisphenolivorans]